MYKGKGIRQGRIPLGGVLKFECREGVILWRRRSQWLLLELRCYKKRTGAEKARISWVRWIRYVEWVRKGNWI